MLSAFRLGYTGLLLATVALAQTTALNFRPVDARYSRALDRIIAVTASPHALHIYDPETSSDVVVALPLPPLSLSVGPSGLYAAVGHDAKISYINLVTGRVEREFTVATKAGNIVLASDYIRVLPAMSVDLRTGVQGGNSSSTPPITGAVLHPSGSRVYGTTGGSPDSVVRLDFSGGTLSSWQGSSVSDVPLCGPVEVSDDGKRIFTPCSTVLTADPHPDGDLRYRTTLEGNVSLNRLASSSAAGRIAAIPTFSTYSPEIQNDGHVRFYDYTWMRYQGRAILPDFAHGGQRFKAHGKWLHFNAAGTALYVIMQADPGSGLLNDFAVHRISSAPPAGCTWSLSTTFAAAGEYGGPASVNVTAPAHCEFRPSTTTPWITLVTTYGAGSAEITYSVAANTAAAPRSGTIAVGGQTLTITQAAAMTPLSNPLYRLAFKPVAAALSKATGRIVLASAAPNELHIFDPVSRSDRVVSLPLTPRSVAAHPAAPYAAVGYDGWLSHVNLLTGTVERHVEIALPADSVVLAQNGFAYVFANGVLSEAAWVDLGNGMPSYAKWLAGAPVVLHPSGKYIYASRGLKLDISTGAPKFVSQIFSFGACGWIWPTSDGARLITGCGAVHRSSEAPASDLTVEGNLSPPTGVKWADHSPSQRLIAVIPMQSSDGTTTDMHLRMFRHDDLTQDGYLSFPQFPGGANTARGSWVFWNQDASALYAVVQADAADKLAADHAIWTVPWTACTVTLSPQTLSVPDVGAAGGIAVTAGSSCAWKVTSSAEWLTVDSDTIGLGSKTIRYSVKPNTTTAARTATISAGGGTFTVTQAAGVPGLCTATLGQAHFTTEASGSSGSVTLTIQGKGCPWTAVSSASWAQVYPLSGTGSQTLHITVYPNFATQSRTARIAVAGHLIGIAQNGTFASVDERYVRFLYFNHFGRHPSTTEVQGHLMSGLSRAQLAVNFLSSLEFSQGGRYVAGLYRGLLNRDAEYGGWLFQRNAVVTGGIAQLTLVDSFLGSEEYRLKFGTPSNTEYAALLYRYILLREGTPSRSRM
jgi:hypothetical protein